MFILSRVRFARSSCTMPITVFPITTGRNVRFQKEPTRQRNTASIVKIRLKYVKIFDFMICATDLPVVICVSLVSPCATRSSTSPAVRPVYFSLSISNTSVL